MKKLLALFLAFSLVLCCACFNDQPQTAEGILQVYFIDVGQADSALIIQGEHAMLVDGGNVADGPDVVSFIKSKNVKKLDVVVATHAHEDHIGGLGTIIDNFTVDKIYCPVNNYDSVAFDEFKDASDRQCGIAISKKGDSWQIGQSLVNVLWPTNTQGLDTNNTSIVFTLKFGKITYLFTGDAEHDVETSIINSGANIKADVLKVGHHGSGTSSSYYFLREVLPTFAVISCGKDNSYGHPHENIIERYKQAEATVLRTDQGGTVCISTDGNEITVKQGNTEQTVQQENATPGIQQTAYVGNKNSKKLHLPSCPNLPKEENREIFDSREEAIDAGYSPCGVCQP